MNKPQRGIAVDGATAGNPGLSKYRGIDLATGEILFESSIGYATNNICEFIGLCHAIGHAVKKNYREVYCDSKTALAWVKNGKVNTTLFVHSKTKQSLEKMDRCLEYLKSLDVEFDGIDLLVHGKLVDINILKWETSIWGEIPADYGNK